MWAKNVRYMYVGSPTQSSLRTRTILMSLYIIKNKYIKEVRHTKTFRILLNHIEA